MTIHKKVKIYLSFILIFLTLNLQAEVSDKDKILILTDYLIKEKSKDTQNIDKKEISRITKESRNEAIATIYGEPIFEDLIYDEDSEMFFGKITSKNKNFSKDINFYMPYNRAINFKKNLKDGRIEIEHIFDDNEIVIKNIDLNYKGVDYPLKVKRPKTVSLKIGKFFVQKQDTDFLVSKNGLGAFIDLQEKFNLQEKMEALRVEATYIFNHKHKVELSWYKLDNSSYTNNLINFEWEGEDIIANTSLKTQFNTEIYKFTYIYSAYQTNKLNLTSRLGLHTTKIETGFSGSYSANGNNVTNQSKVTNVTAPLPVFGLGLSYEIIPDLNINYKIDYFFLSFDDTSGSMTDSLLSLEYMYNHYIGIGVGIESTKMRIKAKANESDLELRHEVTGVLLYFILNY